MRPAAASLEGVQLASADDLVLGQLGLGAAEFLAALGDSSPGAQDPGIDVLAGEALGFIRLVGDERRGVLGVDEGERHGDTVGVAQVDGHTVGDDAAGGPLPVDEHAARAVVVGGDPVVVARFDTHVGARYPDVVDPDLGWRVAPDRDEPSPWCTVCGVPPPQATTSVGGCEPSSDTRSAGR